MIFGTNTELVKAYPVLLFDGHGLGIFLLMWTFFTFMLFIASMKRHNALALLFLTLLLGFIGLDLKELAGSEIAGTLAALINRMRTSGVVSHGGCGICGVGDERRGQALVLIENKKGRKI